MNNSRKIQALVGVFVLALVAIPAALFLSQQNQENRSRATASTTLSYVPTTTESSPLQKKTGDTVSFDVMVTPGSNLPSLVKLEMQYDSTKFQPATNPFVVNASAFPTTVEGPVVVSGKVLITVSIGSDTTKAIQTPTKVGTLTLTAASATTAPTMVSFGSRTEILSVAKLDQSSENVFSSSTPAYVSIAGADVPTQIVTPTKVASTTPTVIPVTPTAIPTQPHTTNLSLDVLLHGIGNSGDNANPTASALSNKEPKHPVRNVDVLVYNDQNQLVASLTNFMTYASVSGNFKGTVNFTTNIEQGDYTIRIKENTHLRRLVPGIIRITPLQTNVLPQIALIAGDVNNDNKLNILDYNVIIGCYSDLSPASNCDDNRKLISDLNDDSNVNQFDYNLFLREITIQNGN